MPDWMDIVNIIVVTSGLTMVLAGLFFSFTLPMLKNPERGYLIVFFSLLTLYCISDLTAQLSLVYFPEGHMMISKIAVFSESFFSSLCLPLLTMFILTGAGRSFKKDRFLISSVTVWGIYFLLLCYTQFSRSIYYFTEDNIYHRGPYYPILLTPPVILIVINLLCLLSCRVDLSRKQFFAFFVYLLLPLLCMAIQMVWYGILMVVLGTCLASALMLNLILWEQTQLFIMQKEEIAAQKISIMMLEMRPHFIYNTLTSIYYLCEQDSKKAQQVTLDFSTYLRKNFTAISKKDTIPFSEELEHTKAYLSVEMARFEGRLFVEYAFSKVPVFRIPPLTLQPIVENSVKHHSLDPDMEPLRISIRVNESPEGNTILVEDNGPGFEAADNDEPHIALKNIRERLKLMCNGTLSISSPLTGGTRVDIFIPFSGKLLMKES